MSVNNLLRLLLDSSPTYCIHQQAHFV